MGKIVEVLLAVSNTVTWVGAGGVLLPGTGNVFGSAPERITFLPSGETVSTLPMTPLNSETVAGVPGVTAISPLVPRNPKSVPIYAFPVLVRSKTKELGVVGRLTAVPTVFAGAVIGTSVLKQPLVVEQSPEADTPVLET